MGNAKAPQKLWAEYGRRGRGTTTFRVWFLVGFLCVGAVESEAHGTIRYGTVRNAEY